MYGDRYLIEAPTAVGTGVLDFTTTGDKARFGPGIAPVIIRGYVVLLNAAPGDAGVVALDKRITFASDTGRLSNQAVINLATTHAAGTPVYKTGLNIKLNPGQEAVINVTDASANVNGARVYFLIEPSWEQPANITAMKATT